MYDTTVTLTLLLTLPPSQPFKGCKGPLCLVRSSVRQPQQQCRISGQGLQDFRRTGLALLTFFFLGALLSGSTQFGSFPNLSSRNCGGVYQRRPEQGGGEGGCACFLQCRSRMTIWYIRTSHPHNAGTGHVGFSQTRQVLLAPSAKRHEVFGESH